MKNGFWEGSGASKETRLGGYGFGPAEDRSLDSVVVKGEEGIDMKNILEEDLIALTMYLLTF